MEDIHISGTDPSSVILGKEISFKKLQIGSECPPPLSLWLMFAKYKSNKYKVIPLI